MKQNSSKTSSQDYYGNSSATNLSTFSAQAQQDQSDEDIKQKIR